MLKLSCPPQRPSYSQEKPSLKTVRRARITMGLSWWKKLSWSIPRLLRRRNWMSGILTRPAFGYFLDPNFMDMPDFPLGIDMEAL
jgi:hypothetical protein